MAKNSKSSYWDSLTAAQQKARIAKMKAGKKAKGGKKPAKKTTKKAKKPSNGRSKSWDNLSAAQQKARVAKMQAGKKSKGKSKAKGSKKAKGGKSRQSKAQSRRWNKMTPAQQKLQVAKMQRGKEISSGMFSGLYKRNGKYKDNASTTAQAVGYGAGALFGVTEVIGIGALVNTLSPADFTSSKFQPILRGGLQLLPVIINTASLKMDAVQKNGNVFRAQKGAAISSGLTAIFTTLFAGKQAYNRFQRDKKAKEAGKEAEVVNKEMTAFMFAEATQNETGMIEQRSTLFGNSLTAEIKYPKTFTEKAIATILGALGISTVYGKKQLTIEVPEITAAPEGAAATAGYFGYQQE